MVHNSFAQAARCAAFFLFAGLAALAQTNSGRISGTASDTSGAVVPGAAVTVTSQDTGLTWKTTTDSGGFYRVTNLPVGTYTVEMEAQGFRKAARTGYDLVDAGSITADFKLEVGAVSQSMIVTEVLGETVNTVSGEIGRTIDSEQVADLALNGRNYMELATLIPGVALTSLDQMATTTSMSVTNQSFNGGRVDSSHLMVDGGWNMDPGSNGSQINNVGVDFIQQVKVQTSAFSAEYGRKSGASINLVTKSGGDRFHGTLFEVIRNDALDAKDFFAPSKPMLRFNDYGWSLGGPIAFGPLKKGKLFFFAGEEWKKIRRFTSPSRQTLPTLAEIQGNFSDRTTTTIRYPGTTTPIPNKDLASLMTPDGKAIMAVYGAMIPLAAAYSNTPTSNNATYQMPNPYNSREDITRLDWRASDRQSVYFRYIHDAYNTIDPFGTFGSSPIPTTPTSRIRPGYSIQLGYNWTISPHLINEAKINVSWHGQRTPMIGDAWKRATYGFQFPRVYGGIGNYGDGMPNVSITNFSSFSGPATVYIFSPTTDITSSDNLTWIHERHAIKTGIMVTRNRQDSNARPAYDGSIAFNPSGNTNTTNYALSDAALGQFQTYTEVNWDAITFYRFTQVEGYVQDSWRITSRLSIEAGLRYCRFNPTYTAFNNMSNFIPSLYDPSKAVTVTTTGLLVPNSGNPYNGIIRAGDGVPADQVGRVPGALSPSTLAIPAGAARGLYDPVNLFMPRFSFAWSPFGNSKTAVRGGFGSFHERIQVNMILSQGTLPPFSYQVQYQNGNLSNPSGGTVAAPAPMGTIHGIDPALKVPGVYTFNFGVQRELGRGFFLDVAYAGNQSRHQIRSPNINEPSFAVLTANQLVPSAQRPVNNALVPYKGYSIIDEYFSDAVSNYNALQTYLTRRKGNLVMTASYTWSKSLADASSYSDVGDNVEWTNRHYNYGPTTFDRRHLFVSTYTYRIPLLRNRHGVVGAVAAGWEVSGVTRFQTGPYLTPNGSTAIGTRRSQYLGGVVALPSDARGPDHWFNTAAFANAPTTGLGNAGVGIIQGPGWQNWDFSLRKVFRIREGWNLRFQADAFNLMNHPNFNAPNVSTSGGTAFGTISGSQPARNIQFGLRLVF